MDNNQLALQKSLEKLALRNSTQVVLLVFYRKVGTTPTC